jgi:hypothetical protein
MPITQLSATSCVGLELRSLPSPGVTRPPGYYGPLLHPRRRSLSLAGICVREPPSPFGLSVLRSISVYRHAVVKIPVARRVVIARGTVYPNRFHSSRRQRPSLSECEVGAPLVVPSLARRSLPLRPVGLSACRAAMRPVCLECEASVVTRVMGRSGPTHDLRWAEVHHIRTVADVVNLEHWLADADGSSPCRFRLSSADCRMRIGTSAGSCIKRRTLRVQARPWIRPRPVPDCRCSRARRRTAGRSGAP